LRARSAALARAGAERREEISMPRVLIADDEDNLRATLARGLRAEGHEVVEARDGVEAVSRLHRGGVDAVLLDLSMPRMDGFGVLEALAEEQNAPPVVVLTAHASLDNAVRAVRAGAFDFLEKPPSIDAVILRLTRAMEAARREAGRQEERRERPEAEMVGTSPPMDELRARIERVAPTPARVLVLGENGTGKELVAREIHRLSPRAGAPLVRVNCAAIPADLFESELFGHVKGAFTGADRHRRGRFELASGGTLFLDEIGEMPLSAQAKLLRALEAGEIERVGAEGSTEIDVRVIAATNRDLQAQVAAGRFREDLYYRLEVVTLVAPPLRDRGDDVLVLARHLLAASCREIGRSVPELDDTALAALSAQPWPGNVRQLSNLMERLAILVPGERIGAAEVREHAGGSAVAAGEHPPHAGPLAEAVAAFERRFIESALARHGGNVTAAARELDFERSSLYKKMRALGMRD
jgi:DNA-binding NtrC family response regulator